MLREPPTVVRRPIISGPARTTIDWPSGTQRFVDAGAYVVLLPGGRVWSSDALVCSEEGVVFLDHARAWGRSTEDLGCWGQRPSITRLPGTTAVVASRGADRSFGHFLLDSLARVQLIRETGITPERWLVSSTRHEWQRAWLELIGLPAERVVSLEELRYTQMLWMGLRTKAAYLPG